MAAQPRRPVFRGSTRRGGDHGTTTIFVAQRLAAAPQQAFDAWIDPEMAGQWLFATATQPMTEVQIDARAGGAFRFSDGKADEVAGRYTEVVAPRCLAFDLALTRHASPLSRVEVVIAADGPGCRIELTHRGVPRAAARGLEARWIGMFYGLGLLLCADDQPLADWRQAGPAAGR